MKLVKYVEMASVLVMKQLRHVQKIVHLQVVLIKAL
jgi:hypothetical protein